MALFFRKEILAVTKNRSRQFKFAATTRKQNDRYRQISEPVCKSMDCFLYDRNLRQVRVNASFNLLQNINAFHVTGLFLRPLKTSENQRFSDVFMGYRKRQVTWNALKNTEMKWHTDLKYAQENFFILRKIFMVYNEFLSGKS